MNDDKGFLNRLYYIRNHDQARDLYQNWAKTYDQEIIGNDYATPHRCARALADLLQDKAAPVLDIGCGTGLSGIALRECGFLTIDGCDFSPEMLKIAAARPGLYRRLWEVDVENPLPFAPGSYAAITAVGVLASDHAPAGMIDDVLQSLTKGGLFVFSLNDHTLQDPSFEARIAENVDTGFARLLFKEHGPHLPGIDLKSTVYVLEKS
ncbi:MAG: class I SAM-dependent methyltransferase [Rhodobacteraceae bacterium]|nr:class I SAM-dependent methyltransferase [Paracoccaceae bacterium]